MYHLFYAETNKGMENIAVLETLALITVQVRQNKYKVNATDHKKFISIK